MLPTAKCPRCEKVCAHVNIQNMPMHENLRPKWHGVAYLCPHCHGILGVQMDPITLKIDTVAETAKAVKGF